MDLMKKKLEELLKTLMEKKFKPEIISQAIMLPGAATDKEDFLNKLILIAKESKTEMEFYNQMEKLTVEM